MKKLLVILIGLFISFEVKSESDNLSGKKLLCERLVETPTIRFTYFEAFEFYSDVRLKHYSYSRTSASGISKVSDAWSYETTVEQIILTSLNPDKYLKTRFFINRQTLDLVKIVRTTYNDDVNTFYSSCKIFDGDLYNHLKEIKQNFDNEVKSKQKI